MAPKNKQPAPRWREFMIEASGRFVNRTGLSLSEGGARYVDSYVEMIANEIVAHGDGEAFLKAVRRGRSTQRQNLRYQLLREVERLTGDAVPRRRPDSNTPDAQALKKTVRLELEQYAAAGRENQ